MMFYKNKCSGCGKCHKVCPNSFKKCGLCGRCETYCPQSARQICGREMTADEVFTEIVKDKMFYTASGGGVTFSGGECMLQIDFLCEILKKCKENGIHTAVDTAGHVPFESFERIMPYTDMFLYDVKLADEQKHKKRTGVSNKLILENLNRLSAAFQGEIIIRIPVIGGVNDSLDEMNGIADILRDVSYKSVELLPYHKMGEHKFEAIGRAPETFTVPSDESISEFKAIIEQKHKM